MKHETAPGGLRVAMGVEGCEAGDDVIDTERLAGDDDSAPFGLLGAPRTDKLRRGA